MTHDTGTTQTVTTPATVEYGPLTEGAECWICDDPIPVDDEPRFRVHVPQGPVCLDCASTEVDRAVAGACAVLNHAARVARSLRPGSPSWAAFDHTLSAGLRTLRENTGRVR